ncbi:MAG: glycosyltransferase [Deltaproteobacteria bacterium]|jgi:tetratricopeptide (TPR) repeat protein|nr:glycosyltransferase [Deltaproteobacteria bacterium]
MDLDALFRPPGGRRDQRAGGADGGPTLGLAMIVKNEAKNLPLSLGPTAGLFDEIVVVDTGSTDQTPELAAGYGARVLHIPWPNDFSAARNFGLERMTSDYVLWLDGDNSIAPADLGYLRGLLDGSETVLLATEVVVPQGDRLWQKRVFPNSPLCRFTGSVHEQLSHPADWPVRRTRAEVRHWGYADGAEARQKGLRNLELLAAAPETAAGDFYHIYQLGRTLYNLRYLQEAARQLARAVRVGKKSALDGRDDDEAGGDLDGLGDRPGDSGARAGGVSPSLWKHCFILMSQTQLKLGQTEEAERTLRTLRRLKPDYGPGRAQLGKFYYDGDRFEESVPELKAALALGCGDPAWGADPARQGFVCACRLAKAEERAGRTGEARRAWREAIGLNPGNPEPWVALAESALAEGEGAEARMLLEQAIRLAPAHRRARMLEASL